MKRIRTDVLLENLTADIRTLLLDAAKLEQLDENQMQRSPGEGQWSIAQILAHLNFYSRFYLPAIEDKLHRHDTSPQSHFTPGWLGNYFTKMMSPGDGEVVKNKMKTMKNAIPAAQVDGFAELKQFIRDQHQLINLLQIAKMSNIGSLRIPTSITSLITMKLGDTFRFFIAHEQRHMLQIRNNLRLIKTDKVMEANLS